MRSSKRRLGVRLVDDTAILNHPGAVVVRSTRDLIDGVAATVLHDPRAPLSIGGFVADGLMHEQGREDQSFAGPYVQWHCVSCHRRIGNDEMLVPRSVVELTLLV